MPINKANFAILPPSIFANSEQFDRLLEILQNFDNSVVFCLQDLVL